MTKTPPATMLEVSGLVEMPSSPKDHSAARRAAPRAYTEIERAPSDDRGSNGRVHFSAHGDIDLAVGPVPGHPCV
jgi:hypothetical protein